MRDKPYTVGKWTFRLGLVPMYYKSHGMIFGFGIFKITRMPHGGCVITKKYYKGFWIRKDFNGFEISF